MSFALSEYPEYRESADAWLGPIPKHWDPQHAGHLGKFTASGIDKKSVPGQVPVKMFNYTDVFKSQSKFLDNHASLMTTTAPLAKSIDHAVREGDILLTPSSETTDDIGHAARVGPIPPGVVYSYHVLRFRATEATCPTYITYCFNSVPTRSFFSSVCAGTTRMTLGRRDFKNAPIALPPLGEQFAIAKFLDHETSKIDALIDKQQQLITLLKEKRQAVISHAVTKGLNPDAPMRDSGVEWLGEVPAHWSVNRLKFLADAFASNVDKKTKDGELPIKLCNYTDVYYNQSVHAELLYMEATATFAEIEKFRLHAGDTIITKDSEDPNDIAVPTFVEQDMPGVICGYHLSMIRPGPFMAPGYLNKTFQCAFSRSYFASRSNGLTRYGLGAQALKSVVLPVPPVEEQTQIAKFLDHETSKIDELCEKAETTIDLLQERRTALISAAVTGKIDVRKWSPDPAPAEAEVA